MKLSKFYQNINLDFNIKSVKSNINKIQKNCIFVNLQNHSFFKIDDGIKDHVIIVSSSPILDKSIYSIVVPNIKAEYRRLMKNADILFYKACFRSCGINDVRNGLTVQER